MEIIDITVRKRDSYLVTDSSPETYVGTATLKGGNSWQPEIKVHLMPEELEPIVSILSQRVAASLSAAAERFTADVQASLTGPAIDAKAIADQSGA